MLVTVNVQTARYTFCVGVFCISLPNFTCLYQEFIILCHETETQTEYTHGLRCFTLNSIPIRPQVNSV